MKILILGGNSFTAKYFSWHAKYNCKFVSRDDKFNNTLNLSFLEYVESTIMEFKPEIIINLISISATNVPDYKKYLDANFTICHRVLQFCAANKLKLEKFIQASSAHVYGSIESQNICESTLVNPASRYGKSKLMTELLTEFYNDDFPIINARPFNYTGLGQNFQNFFIPKLVSAAVLKQKSINLGNLEVTRDFSDVRDIARYYEGLILNNNFEGTVNLCSGTGYKLSNVVDLVEQLSGHKFAVIKDPKLDNKGPSIQIGCNKNLRQITSLYPLYTLDDTLNWMLQNFRGKA